MRHTVRSRVGVLGGVPSLGGGSLGARRREDGVRTGHEVHRWVGVAAHPWSRRC
jgi:hypothetical protein